MSDADERVTMGAGGRLTVKRNGGKVDVLCDEGGDTFGAGDLFELRELLRRASEERMGDNDG